MKSLDSYIAHLPYFVRSSLCEEIIREFDGDGLWHQAKVAGGELRDTRLCDVLPISTSQVIGSNPNRQLIDNRLFEVFAEAGRYYTSTRGMCGYSGDSGYDLLRYKPEGHYDFHVDSGFGGEDLRVLSMILNLSSMDDYFGGNLEFEEGPIFALDRGDVVVFPSNFCFPHRITPITDGTRYSIVTWFL
jgi:predicted 2-oxoglutarate/Fe(II)-dependent dioxygenase YbiX